MMTDDPILTSESAPETPAPEAVVVAEPPPEDAVPEVAPPEDAVAAAPAASDNKRWYIVKVQSGREETIKAAILRKVRIESLEEYFGQIYIPTEKVTEMRKGKRVTREKKKLPGYIMAEVEFNDRILYLFRETSGVGDFVGGTNNKPPPPMSPREVSQWFQTKPEGAEEDKPAVVQHDFEKGDKVKVKDGMFKEMEGDITAILEEKNQVQVELTIFGRAMRVELEYWQVEHV